MASQPGSEYRTTDAVSMDAADGDPGTAMDQAGAGEQTAGSAAMSEPAYDPAADYAADYAAAPMTAEPSFHADMEDARPRGTFILWTAGIVTVIWLAAAAATVFLLLINAPAREVALTEWAAVAAGVFAPVTAIWLVALTVARVDPGRGRRSLASIEAAESRFHAALANMEARIGGVDRMLVDAAERSQNVTEQLSGQADIFERSADRAADIARSVSASLSQDRERLDHAISRLAERGEMTHDRLSALGDILPLLTQEAERVGEIFEGHSRAAEARTREIGGLVETLEERADRAAAGAAERGEEAASLLTRMDEQMNGVRAAIAAEEERLQDIVGGALLQAEEALTRMRTALAEDVAAAQSSTQDIAEEVRRDLVGSADAIAGAARGAHELLGREARDLTENVDARLERLVALADTLGASLEERRGEVAALFDQADSRAEMFSGRVTDAVESGGNALNGLSARMDDTEARARNVAAPLSEAQDYAGTVGQMLGEIEGRISSVRSELEGTLPAEIAARREEFGALSQEADGLYRSVEDMRGALSGFEEPVATLRSSLSAGIAALDEARAGLAATTATLETDLSNANAQIAEIGRSADETAMGAADRLIEALGRVREVATQASRSVRDTFDTVVEQAVASLEQAGSEAVSRAVATPVEENIARIQALGNRAAEAAQAAADRLGRSLVSVAETAAAVEARVSEANDYLESAQRSDLAEQSNLLIEALNSNAIDITKALSTEVTETAWKQYLAGDRSVFSRRASRLVDAGGAKEIARHYEEEPEFRDAVRRYLHDFETMLRRVMKDREGNAMSVALLSSDVGRLYVALAQGTDRLRGRE